jgi:hypothetical protein
VHVVVFEIRQHQDAPGVGRLPASVGEVGRRIALVCFVVVDDRQRKLFEVSEVGCACRRDPNPVDRREQQPQEDADDDDDDG